MAKANENENGKNQENEFEFEFINDDEIEMSKRGRKAKINEELVAKLQRAPKNKTFMLKEFAIDPNSEKASSKKSAISAEIRKHLKKANHQEFQIKWTLSGVPCITITK